MEEYFRTRDFLSTFPIWLRSIWDTHSMIFGTLGLFRVSRHQLRNWSLSKPSLTTKRAMTVCPHFSSSSPITTTSWTSSCSSIRLSISSALTRKPPDLITSTDVRPTILKVRESARYWAVSPVLNQPSCVNESLVSCALFR